MIAIVWALAILLGSLSLFWLEPMFARMVLPTLGGSAAVWNTCMVFYQVVLLMGYTYAWLSLRYLTTRQQIILQVSLLGLSFVLMPLAMPADLAAPVDSSPILWLTGVLAQVIGLPFFLLAAQGPLLQGWYAKLGRPDSHDPYYLYGASNLGSMAALLGYPLILEVWLPLGTQTQWWSWTYAGWFLLIVGTVAYTWRQTRAEQAETQSNNAQQHETANTEPAPSWRSQWQWGLHAAVPSALLLGCTAYLSGDLASIPLIWIVPLTLYLATFVIVFSSSGFSSQIMDMFAKRRWRDRPRWQQAFMLSLALGLILGAVFFNQSLWFLIASHGALFFLLTLGIHHQLAEDRPSAQYLGLYYFWLSLGGAVGGMSVLFIAPLVFTHLHEYIVLIGVALVMQPQLRRSVGPLSNRAKIALATIITVIAIPGWLFPIEIARLNLKLAEIAPTLEPDLRWVVTAVIIVVIAWLRQRPRAMGIVLLCLLWASSTYPAGGRWTEETARSFYGRHRIIFDERHQARVIENGNTIHGGQLLGERRRHIGLAYYSEAGPLGQIMRWINQRSGREKIAVIGLGAGCMTHYAQPEQTWTFYEIDPEVVRLARDAGYFDCITASPAPTSIVLGDGRGRIAEAMDGEYDLIVVDAFGSNSIPVHLLTAQALEIYLGKLKPDGAIALHISNRYLKLAPVVATLAQHAGLKSWQRIDVREHNPEFDLVKTSHWALIAGPEARVPTMPDWQPLIADADRQLWTDDYSSVAVLLD